MKKTTYILFGSILGGILLIIATLIVLKWVGVSQGNFRMKFSGQAKTIKLPPSKIIKYCRNWETSSKYPACVFHDSTLQVDSSATADNTLTIPADFEKQLILKSKGDTLEILFNFAERNPEQFNYIVVNMKLSLARTTIGIINDVNSFNLDINNLKRDTMTIISKGNLVINNCDISALNTQAYIFRLESGRIGDMYLNIDDVRAWNVNTKKGIIETAHISGSARHTMNMDGCNELILTPTSDAAQLIFESKESVKITRNK